jgi:hypothetical protein
MGDIDMRRLWRVVTTGWLLILAGVLCVNADASIVLKMRGMNPSKTHAKKAILKTYLPEEIKPEDVLSTGELELRYDEQQKVYLVFGEVELAPQESVEVEIELNDIWHVPQDELERRRQDSSTVLDLLADSEFADKVPYLRKSIEERLTKIEHSQATPAVNPQKHISQYRENKRLLNLIDDDLAVARSLMDNAKKIPSLKIWQLILAVIGLLVVMSGALFFVLNRQMYSFDDASAGVKVVDLKGKGRDSPDGEIIDDIVDSIK